ncbi:hypothetical protein QF205_09650 [Luteimonas composti]|uniref:Uncharacterized protein n=1 Tax=Luteimonas composti TaxID=398257 RepID=A0ABT6MRS8_9GAMM|nr:hypothetical protein [Luteimonas composti]MDH7453327.1 hypothetical protein [Luteimonas composti]
MIIRCVLPTFALALLLAGPTFAKTKIEFADHAAFQTQKAKIEAEMIKGGEYGEISTEGRAAVLSHLEAIGHALGGNSGAGSAAERQVEIYNHQSAVNQILTQAAEDSRVVCTRQRKTGSKFATNRCITVAEQRREREGARDWARTVNRTMRPEGSP